MADSSPRRPGTGAGRTCLVAGSQSGQSLGIRAAPAIPPAALRSLGSRNPSHSGPSVSVTNRTGSGSPASQRPVRIANRLLFMRLQSVTPPRRVPALPSGIGPSSGPYLVSWYATTPARQYADLHELPSPGMSPSPVSVTIAGGIASERGGDGGLGAACLRWCRRARVPKSGLPPQTGPVCRRAGCPTTGPQRTPRQSHPVSTGPLSRHFQFHPACSSATALLQLVLFRYSDGFGPSTPNLPTSRYSSHLACDGPGVQSQSYRRHTRAGSACHAFGIGSGASIWACRAGYTRPSMPRRCSRNASGPSSTAPPEHNRHRDAAVLPASPSPRPARRTGSLCTKFRQGCNRRFQIYCLSTVNWVTINVPVVTAVVFK